MGWRKKQLVTVIVSDDKKWYRLELGEYFSKSTYSVADESDARSVSRVTGLSFPVVGSKDDPYDNVVESVKNLLWENEGFDRKSWHLRPDGSTHRLVAFYDNENWYK